MTGKMGIGMTGKMGIGMTGKIEIENGNEKREREKTFMPEFSLRAILVPKSRNKFKMMGAMHPRIHASTQKKIVSQYMKRSFRLVPEVGLEPTRCCHRQILSLVRLPFRHSGLFQ